jgi:Carbamoyltransferase C-terminus
MPFAPSVLAEHAERCFEGVAGAEDTARFMTITFGCTKHMRERAPGVVHVDGTARPQLVGATDNPGYRRIIEEFMHLTGLPCVVNTSFNIHEEPIVCSPPDAVRAFVQGNLDMLAIGPFLAEGPQADERVRRAARPQWRSEAAEAWSGGRTRPQVILRPADVRAQRRSQRLAQCPFASSRRSARCAM